MWPFSKFCRLKRERMKTEAKLGAILTHMTRLLEDVGGEFVMNSMGSGDITFKLGKQRFEFNQFGSKFTGFFIDNQPVPFGEFLSKAQSFEPENHFII